jgi:hypothetical protein
MIYIDQKWTGADELLNEQSLLVTGKRELLFSGDRLIDSSSCARLIRGVFTDYQQNVFRAL